MQLDDLVRRRRATPWGDSACKIPWDEPGFSARMLREHLSQAHDRASRRFSIIDLQVSWLHETILQSKASRVLDLGCGPGLYSRRLAHLGHYCVGIDFSPASLEYARSESEGGCEYRQGDLRTTDFGSGYDVALLISGELNTFSPEDAQSILEKARAALKAGGAVVLEVHSEAFVRSIGAQAPSWFTAEQSVFSDTPHVWLKECAWHPKQQAATEEFYVASSGSTDFESFVSTTQAYSDAKYEALLRDSGFAASDRHASLTGNCAEAEAGLFVLLARER